MVYVLMIVSVGLVPGLLLKPWIAFSVPVLWWTVWAVGIHQLWWDKSAGDFFGGSTLDIAEVAMGLTAASWLACALGVFFRRVVVGQFESSHS